MKFVVWASSLTVRATRSVWHKRSDDGDRLGNIPEQLPQIVLETR